MKLHERERIREETNELAKRILHGRRTSKRETKWEGNVVLRWLKEEQFFYIYLKHVKGVEGGGE